MKKTKLNPTSIGSLVLCLIALVILSLIFFQSRFFFNQPLRFIAYFDEAVQGLDVGSSVKLRGVGIGHVVSVSVQYDWKTNQSKVVVIGDLNKKALMDATGKLTTIKDSSMLKKLVEEGLRAKIALVGITGLQFVELDFFETNKHSEDSVNNTTSYPMIPTINSGMSELADDMVALAKNARKIDFAQLSTEFTATAKELKTLINSLNTETKNLPLKKMVAQITNAANSIQRLADYLDRNPSALIFGRKPSPSR